jgi:hypothetical protein
VKTFREIVREAVDAVDRELDLDTDTLAVWIERGLRGEGIRLHDSEKCIRLPGIENLGRPITAAELKAHRIDPGIYGFSEGEGA